MKEKILQAVEAEDWYLVGKLSHEARVAAIADEEYFGTKREFVSIINDCNNSDNLQELLQLAGFKVFKGHYGNLLKKLQKGELIPNDKVNSIAILTSSDSMKARLEAEGFLCQKYFACDIGMYAVRNHLPYPHGDKDKDRKFILRQLETGKEYKLTEEIAKAVGRDRKINKILN